MRSVLSRSGCWLLLALMAMAPLAQAAQASAFLCRGQVRLSLARSCCCPEQALKPVSRADADVFAAPTGERCCVPMVVSQGDQRPAHGAERVLLELAPRLPPPAQGLALAVPEQIHLTAQRSRAAAGPDRVRAAPLFLQLHQWLI